MKIGLTPHDFVGWQGGRELFEFFADSLIAFDEDDEIVIATKAGIGNLRYISRRLRHASRNILGQRADGSTVFSDLDMMAHPLNHQAAKHFDVIGPLGTARRNVGTPWIGYLADLQHRRLPEMFTAAERTARDRNIASMLNEAALIVVNAADVANDIRNYYPDAKCPVHVLPFAPCPQPAWFDLEPLAAADRPFFLCSNQFWKHKNHMVVLEAVSLARKSGSPLRVFFTGATWDYRHPEYFETLKDYIENNGISDDISILGFIPKLQQIQLMKSASAVIQPSLFEGAPGGGAIYNAIALGRPTIVSDIPVNREISEFVTSYFDPGDPRQLLDKLRQAENVRPRSPHPVQLMTTGEERRRAFGAALHNAFRTAGANGKGPTVERHWEVQYGL